MLVPPKAIYRFNAIPMKIPGAFLTEEKTFLKIMWDHKREAKEILRKNKAGDIILPELKLYHILEVIKTVCYCHKNRKINQWVRIQSPEMTLSIYSQLVFCKRPKNTQWRKDNKFCLGKWLFICKSMKLDPYLTPLIKSNWKWINNLNVRPETMKFTEENMGRNSLTWVL
uniref:Uncharacterized protein n=1 Tax=Sus scrofa TaxID=9823 RepID=A0A8D0U6U2_PIG